VTSYVLSAVGGYVLGSLPLGYLLVRHHTRIDIRTSGSGNVGAFNAKVVTGSNTLGIVVGLLDAAKGLAAVAGAWLLFGTFWSAGIALLASVIGHIAPVWLRFKGGRGLATACGGFFAVGLAFTIVWCTVWALCKWGKLSILHANLVAIIAAPLILLLLPSVALEATMTSGATASDYRTLGICLSAILLVSHRDVLRAPREEISS
jgi:glycerol-3-phosphate acyltransferase PlsY